jgi:predicted transcriptional regulator of viral defense system
MSFRKPAAQAIIELLAEENRRVLSDWRALLLLRRATRDIPADRRRWSEVPRDTSAIAPLLGQMVARGELTPLDGVPHLFVVTVPYARTGLVEEDEIVMELHPYAALAYLSALAFHALTEALPKTITVAVPHDGRGGLLPPGTAEADWQELALVPGVHPRTILGRPVEWVRLTAERSFGAHLYQPRGYPVRVMSPERTLLDGLLAPERCGGFDNVLGAWVRARDTLDLDRLVEYVERLDVGVVRQRAGFLLEELDLSHPALARWQARARRGGSSKLLGSAPYAPTYSERWSLSLNAPLTALRAAAA